MLIFLIFEQIISQLLKIFMSQKANLKRLYSVWLQLHDILGGIGQAA